jgi:co-chaperonin GroES (HSP10)
MGVGIQLVAPSVPEEQSLGGVLRPVGYRILVRIVSPDDQGLREKMERLTHMPDDVRDREWGAQVWAEVMELGPDAYKDEKRFPSGPWCKVGDTILMRPYSGTRFKVGDYLYALINDDTVQGTTTRPEAIERV